MNIIIYIFVSRLRTRDTCVYEPRPHSMLISSLLVCSLLLPACSAGSETPETPPIPVWQDQFTSKIVIRVEQYGPEWSSNGVVYYDWTKKVGGDKFTVPFMFSRTPCFVHFTDLQSWLHRLVPAAVRLWAYRSQRLHLHVPRHWREYVLCKPHCQPLAGQPVLHVWKGNCFRLYSLLSDLRSLFASTCRALLPFLLTGWRTVSTMVLLLLGWALLDLVVQSLAIITLPSPGHWLWCMVVSRH